MQPQKEGPDTKLILPAERKKQYNILQQKHSNLVPAQ